MIIREMLKTLVLKWTHKIWNRRISAILCRAYNDRVINSRQLHELAAAFDHTQHHKVYGKNKSSGFSPSNALKKEQQRLEDEVAA
jgi:hypothetical protein